MTTVYLAEKPSQARDIAAVLGIKRRDDGYIELANGDVMTWAIGHLIELAEPEEYNPSWGGRWSWPQLPMIPSAWKLQVVKKTSKQFTVIKNALKKATRVVICTDAGREGELIAREILEHVGFRGTIERFWTSALTPADIKAALAKLKPGAETVGYFEAARARQTSDWMHGLSGTRGASLAADVRGDYFPLGRVQTPTLAMVVRRDLEIKNFGAKTYYELEAVATTKSGKTFKMTHSPDEANRITDRAKAEALAKKANKHTGPLKVEKTPGSEAPPLPFSLPQLQKEANRVLGLSAKATLKLAQQLYEAKAITYPRTDCQFLANSQVAEVRGVLAAVAKRFGAQVGRLEALGIVTRSSTFNDSKLTDHHAIIPTAESVFLEGEALDLYRLICQRYLQTLGPDCKFVSTRVTMDANGVPFKATGKVVTSPGWQELKLA